MDWWLVTFFIGALLSLFLPIVPALFQLFCLLLLALLLFYYKPLRTSSGLLFAMVWVLFNAWLYQSQLPAFVIDVMQKKQSMVIGAQILNLQHSTLESLSLTSPKKSHQSTLLSNKTKPRTPVKLNVKVLSVNEVLLDRAFIARLSWKIDKTLIHSDLAQGQIVNLTVKLKPAHGLANLGGFNYQTWLKSQHISATGYVINASTKDNSTGNSVGIVETINGDISFRQALFSQYKRILPEQLLAPLLLALGFGERSGLTAEYWQLFQATGTGHLIAISGLHIGLVASGCFYMVMFAIRVVPSRLLILFGANKVGFQQFNSRYVAIVVSISVAFFYGYLAGFSLPTQRALVMLLLYWFSRLFFIKLSVIRWILITLFILVVISPFSLFTASFWLSVYAVSIIFLTLWRFRYYLQGGNAVIRFVKGLVIIQLSLTVMILPITALFFQQVSTVALFANLLAVPWMSLITIPITLLSVVTLCLENMLALLFSWQSNHEITRAIISLSISSLTWLWQWLSWLAALEFSMLKLPLIEQKLMLVVGSLLTFLMFFNCFRYRLWLIFSTISTILVACYCYFSLTIVDHSDTPSPLKKESWHVIMFDVGQGLSVLITRGERAILYDTGAAYPSGFNMSEAVILPYLQYANIKQLDKVILSHSDNDHAGGIMQLADTVTIKQLMTNDVNIINQFNNHTAYEKSVSSCQQGDNFQWQELTFQVLWPTPSGNDQKQSNDDSCVILISHGESSVLLTGDISKKVEQQLIKQYPELNVNVLITPHHGSKTSSSDLFLQQLSPELALVSAGFLNRWHMPVSEVLSRYQENNIRVITTATSGQIFVTFSEGKLVGNKIGVTKESTKNNIRVQTYRGDFRPFWFTN